MLRYKDPDLSDYLSWLKRQKYQDNTILVTLRNLRTAASEPARLPTHRIPHVRRYLRFVQETGSNPLGRRFLSAMKAKKIGAASEIVKTGARGKQISKVQLSALRARLRRGDNTSKLVVAYMHSPYRISDFLILRCSRLTDRDVADKISRDWLRKEGGPNLLYQVLCDTERCAYARMRKRLLEVCDSLGFKTDLDTLYKFRKELMNGSSKRAVA